MSGCALIQRWLQPACLSLTWTCELPHTHTQPPRFSLSVVSFRVVGGEEGVLERHVRHRLAQVRVHLARGGEDALHARRRDRDGEVLLGYYVGMVNEVAVVRRPAPGPPSPRRGPPSPKV